MVHRWMRIRQHLPFTSVEQMSSFMTYHAVLLNNQSWHKGPLRYLKPHPPTNFCCVTSRLIYNRVLYTCTEHRYPNSQILSAFDLWKSLRVIFQHANGFHIYYFVSVFNKNTWATSASLHGIRLHNMNDIACDLSGLLKVKCNDAAGLLQWFLLVSKVAYAYLSL